MNYYIQPEFDNGNLIDTNSIEIKRNKYNMPLLLCYTHNDEYVEATVRHDGSIFISYDKDTIFAEELGLTWDIKDFICVYTDRAVRDLEAWIKTQDIPEFSSYPVQLSNIRYIERDPGVGELTVECVVNEFTKNSLCIDLETMSVVDSVFDEIPAILVQECADCGGDVEVLKKHNEIDREISRQLNEFIQSHPYHPANDMLSYRMEYGVFYYDHDFSEIKHYDVPVSVEGEKGRLIVNRKNSFWEACLYIHDEKWAKMEQNETPKNGGFAHMNDDDFLMRVITVYGFVKGIFIDLDDTPLAA